MFVPVAFVNIKFVVVTFVAFKYVMVEVVIVVAPDAESPPEIEMVLPLITMSGVPVTEVLLR